MAAILVKPTASGSGTTGGLGKHRGEQTAIAAGRIAAAGYASGDTISFEISASKILYAHFRVQAATPVDKFVFPGVSLASAIPVAEGAVKSDIDYYIVYKRGSGANLRLAPTVA